MTERWKRNTGFKIPLCSWKSIRTVGLERVDNTPFGTTLQEYLELAKGPRRKTGGKQIIQTEHEVDPAVSTGVP